MARVRKHNAWNEVMGLVFLGIGIVLFLALVSYTPKDIPSWVWFSYMSPPNNPAQNFVGPTGAIVAGFLYMTLGAASYLVATIFLGFGGAKLFLANFGVAKRLPWALLFLISGASVIHLQTSFLHNWKHEFNILGPGGWTGYWFGGFLLQNALGQLGSIICLSIVYVVSLIWLTGIRPIHLIKQSVLGTKEFFQKIIADNERRRLEAADERGRLEANQKKLERQIRKQKRELKKKGALPEEGEIPDRPEPKIIDASSVLPAKPSLGDVRSKGAEKEPAMQMAEKHIENYQLPSLDLLDAIDLEGRRAADPAELKQIQNVLIDTLKQFNIEASPGDITRGPTITRYEVYPARGVRVDKISSLERDL